MANASIVVELMNGTNISVQLLASRAESVERQIISNQFACRSKELTL